MRRCGRWISPLVAVATLAACATYWPTLDGNSRSSAEETYRCAKEQVSRAGFKPTTWNDHQMSLDARRPDAAATDQLPREQKQFDQLRVQVKRANGGTGSTMSVRAQTMLLRFSREGWVTDNVPASAGAQDAARELIRQCS
jgi:hypothetical protein